MMSPAMAPSMAGTSGSRDYPESHLTILRRAPGLDFSFPFPVRAGFSLPIRQADGRLKPALQEMPILLAIRSEAVRKLSFANVTDENSE